MSESRKRKILPKNFALLLERRDLDDLSFAEGKEDELLGRLQRRLGKSKEDLRAEIEKL